MRTERLLFLCCFDKVMHVHANGEWPALGERVGRLTSGRACYQPQVSTASMAQGLLLSCSCNDIRGAYLVVCCVMPLQRHAV